MRLGITGHQTLPPEVAAELKRTIRELAESESIRLIASLAVGADQIAAEAVLGYGGQLEVVVPCDQYEATFTIGESLQTYQRLLAHAAQVSVLPFPSPTEPAFMAAGILVVDRCDRLLAAWDGEPARGLGGTADVVRYARREHKPIINVWPSGVRRQ